MTCRTAPPKSLQPPMTSKRRFLHAKAVCPSRVSPRTLARRSIAGTLLALSTLVSAQSLNLKVPAPNPLDPAGSVEAMNEAMNDTLQRSGPVQRELLLRRLGLDPALAHQAATQHIDLGPHFDETDGSGLTLLFVPCAAGGGPEAHLFLLRPAPGHRLHVTDDASLDCWWKPASYDVVQLSGRPSMAVLAHHANAGHGSGFVEDDMLLLEARAGRWATLLRTPEYRSEDKAGTGKTVEQASTLQPLPDGSVEETRATTLHEPGPHNAISAKAPEQVRLTTVERRRWVWNQATQSYHPGTFAAVNR